MRLTRRPITQTRHYATALVAVLSIIVLSACNLSSSEPVQETLALSPSPEVTADLTQTSTLPTRTVQGTASVPTLIQITQRPPSTFVVLPPTSAVVFPTLSQNQQTPVNIAILSPVSNSVVAGNVQVLGSATHPQFLQYQLEYGPDPNAANLWYPITGGVSVPAQNTLLGVWTTSIIPDGNYQLRLRVYLRDGTTQQTSINNVRVQNAAPTPVPSATASVPRPIAAFTQNVTTGQAPLTVNFFNQSSGQVTSQTWNFGDGATSTQLNPTHTFAAPGLYNVTLTVNGPGGTSNVSQQINVQSPTAPVAAFTQSATQGIAPLTVQFTNQSTGNFNSVFWNFFDGTTSTQNNPSHTFTVPGTYTVFLTVTGPGGSSFANRTITVQSPATNTFTQQPPTTAATTQPAPTATQTSLPPTATVTDVPPTATHTLIPPSETPTDVPPTPTETATQIPAPLANFSADVTVGYAPLTVTFTNLTTGQVDSVAWDFQNDGTVDSTEFSPQFTFVNPGTYNVVLTASNAGGSNSFSSQITVQAGVTPPTASFSANPTSGDAPLTVQFTDTSQGTITSWSWDFNADGIPDDTTQNPSFQFTTAGVYNVILTVANEGGQNSTAVQITVTEPQVLGNTTPVQPNLGDPSINNTIQSTYNAGQPAGRQNTVFAVTGDLLFSQPGVLDTFAQTGGYNLDANSYLQGSVDWFAQDPETDGINNFNRSRTAVNPNWTAQALLDPSNANPSVCLPGETPIACEIRTTNSAVMLIAVGSRDAAQGTPPGDFSGQLQQIVNTALSNGVIPVLVTVPPNPGAAASINAINNSIITLASSSQIPLVNLWQAINSASNGVNPDGSLTVAPGGAGDLSPAAVATYGVNAANLELLRVLDSIRGALFP
jgi:PKD repeat protein